MEKEKTSLTIATHIAEAPAKPKHFEIDELKSVALAENALQSHMPKNNNTIVGKIANKIAQKTPSQPNSISQHLTKASTAININQNTIEKVDKSLNIKFLKLYKWQFFINKNILNSILVEEQANLPDSYRLKGAVTVPKEVDEPMLVTIKKKADPDKLNKRSNYHFI